MREIDKLCPVKCGIRGEWEDRRELTCDAGDCAWFDESGHCAVLYTSWWLLNINDTLDEIDKSLKVIAEEYSKEE